MTSLLTESDAAGEGEEEWGAQKFSNQSRGHVGLGTAAQDIGQAENIGMEGLEGG